MNISSPTGLLANPHLGLHAVSNYGVVDITPAMAADLGHYQIIIICVSPTTAETPMGLKSTTPEFRD